MTTVGTSVGVHTVAARRGPRYISRVKRRGISVGSSSVTPQRYACATAACTTTDEARLLISQLFRVSASFGH